MLHSSLSALCFVSLIGVVQPAAAGTITVGPAGADFTDLVLAVEAAGRGDTIWVAEGDFITAGVGLVIDKPLTIIGAGSQRTTFRSGFAPQIGAGIPLVIQNLAPDEEVRVIGINMESEAVCFCPDELVGPELVKVLDCAGLVTLGDVTGYSNGGTPSGTFEIVNCAQVVMDGVHASSGGLGPGMRVVNSFVTLNASGITGGAGSLYFFGDHPDGFPGVQAIGSSVWFSRSGVAGGDAGGGPFLPFGDWTPGVGAPGLSGVSSDFHVRGEALRWIEGGRGAKGMLGGFPVYTKGAVAVELSSDSQLETTPGAKLFPGMDGDFVVTQPEVSPTGTWTQLSEWLTMLKAKNSVLSLSENLAHVGTTKVMEVSGQAASFVVPFGSVGQVPGFTLPGIMGLAVIDPASFVSFPFVQLDASGRAEFALFIPNLPGLEGTTVLFQGLGFSPSGQISISLAIPLAIVQ